jgi:hypothetical protein
MTRTPDGCRIIAEQARIQHQYQRDEKEREWKNHRSGFFNCQTNR